MQNKIRIWQAAAAKLVVFLNFSLSGSMTTAGCLNCADMASNALLRRRAALAKGERGIFDGLMLGFLGQVRVVEMWEDVSVLGLVIQRLLWVSNFTGSDLQSRRHPGFVGRGASGGRQGATLLLDCESAQAEPAGPGLCYC